ncbi:hypothetical protein [Hoeflea sp.]|uniref:hypothetical protein n=1 Tax=Hoeflea sp. TaxID=1940281 RepID=UPI002AFF6839|nr:hypothetical protein [Hoeflea sp.]
MPKDKRNPTIRAMLAREIRNTQKNARAGADTLLFMTNATAAIVAKALTNHARGRLIMLDIRCPASGLLPDLRQCRKDQLFLYF